VKLEMDIYWAMAAKADPIAYFARHPGRYRQCHLKDGTANGDLMPTGAGIVNFPAVLQAARKAGIEHYYVEYDRADDPMAATRQSYDYLRKFF
jgi:sugar phosphate isomerase/epimerase